jgi:hypothetical protein
MSKISRTGLIMFMFALVEGDKLPRELQTIRAAVAGIGFVLFIFGDEMRKNATV